MSYKKIILRPGKEAPVKRFHPWVFSGAIMKKDGDLNNGDIVELFSSGGEYLATGHFQDSNIAVKIFSFEQVAIDPGFWRKKLQQALNLRRSLGLTDQHGAASYRLVFSEGDGLPGLIMDYYAGNVVIQCQTAGMHRVIDQLVVILKDLFGNDLQSVYDKSQESYRHPDPVETTAGRFLYGSREGTEILENGHRFLVDWVKGQKTGFYLDQRYNRLLAGSYASGRKVLNAFCYSGGFSVYAAKGDASLVHSVDSSAQAIGWTKHNLETNGIPVEKHAEFVADVKQFLPSLNETYDMIILDPPAFAKTHLVTHNALQAYTFINAEAIKRLAGGGILFTFSCSQAVSPDMFRSAVQSAAIEAGRETRILHTLSQGPDHPVSIFHPEGLYLKGLVLVVD
jgi:23S rRNA (cytosine1962-C5)-methyltransferase